jgi:hypothetical protein
MAVFTDLSYGDSAFVGKSKRHSSGNKFDCPVCLGVGGRWNCGESAGATDGGVNCSNEEGKQWESVNGYTCTKPKNNAGTAPVSVWLPSDKVHKNSVEETAEQKADRARRTAQAEADRAAAEARRHVAPETIAGRDPAYRSLIGKTELSDKAYQDLLRRDFDAVAIASKLASGDFIPVGKGVRVAGIANVWGDRPGFLVAAKNAYGKIVGAQFKPDSPKDGEGKYIWNSSAAHPGYMSNGKLPVFYVPGSNPTGHAIACEGGLKMHLCAHKFGTENFAGFYSGGSCSEFPSIAARVVSDSQEESFTSVLLLSDSGSHANPNVLPSLIKWDEAIRAGGLTSLQCDYGQLNSKKVGDPDEQDKDFNPLDYAVPFKAMLGMAIELRNGVISATHPATDIHQIRTMSPASLKKSFEKNEIVLLSDRAELGAVIFAPNLNSAKGLVDLLGGKDGIDQRRTLALCDNFFRPESDGAWLEGHQDLKVIQPDGFNTVSRILNRQKKQATSVTFGEGGEYLGTCQNLIDLAKKIIAGDRTALCLLAPMGAGKSQFLKLIINQLERAVTVAPTTMLAKELAFMLNAVLYNNSGSAQIDKLVTTLHSLYQDGHLAGSYFYGGGFRPAFIEQGGMMAMDEIQSLLETAVISEIGAKDRRHRLEELIQMIQQCNALVMADANPHSATMAFLKTIRPDLQFVSIAKAQQQRKLYSYPTSAELLHQLTQDLKLVKAGKLDPIAVFTDKVEAHGSDPSLKFVMEAALAAGYKQDEIAAWFKEALTCTDHPAHGADPKHIEKTLLVIGSPSVQAGISLDADKHFSKVFLFGFGVANVEGLLQFSGRCRNYDELHAYVQKGLSGGLNSHKLATATHDAMIETTMELLDAAHQSGEDTAAIAAGQNNIYTQVGSVFDGDRPENIFARAIADAAAISAQNLKIEFFGELLATGNYELCPITPVSQHILDQVKADCKEISNIISEKETHETVALETCNQTEFDDMGKGKPVTVSVYRTAEKFQPEQLTNNEVKFTTVEQIKTFRKANGLRGIISHIRLLYEQAAETKAKIIEGLNKIDPKRSYASENSPLKTDMIMHLVKSSSIKDELLALAERSRTNPVSKDDMQPLIKAIKAQPKLLALMGSVFEGKDKRQETKFATKLYKLLGFEIVSHRTKRGYVYTFRTPDFTQQIIEWRAKNPEFVPSNPNLTLPKISPP